MQTSLRGFVRRHPAASYFALTFAISWGVIVLLMIVQRTGLIATKEDFERLLPLWVVALVLGPSVSGVLMTWLVGGRQGLRDYKARLLRWRVGARWYAAALLTAPLYFLAVGLAMSAFSPELLPGLFTSDDPAALVIRGLAIALIAGVVEELGWTGFAVPTLRRRHGAVATGLIVGVLWGIWHFLPKIWGSAANDLVAYMPVDLMTAVVGLTGFRILMVWVYDGTRSLLLGILMHAGLTFSTLVLQPLITGAPLIRIGLALAVAPWLIVAAVAWIRYRRARTTADAGWAASPAG